MEGYTAFLVRCALIIACCSPLVVDGGGGKSPFFDIEVEIDTLVVVDYNIYSYFEQNSTDPVFGVREFVSAMFKEVNLRLQDIRLDFAVDIQAKVNGIYIPPNSSDIPTMTTGDPLQTDILLFEQWLVNKNLNGYEFHVLLTRDLLYEQGNETRVVVQPGLFCNSSGLAISHTKGFETSIHIFWAIMFRLGAQITDDDEHGCSCDGSNDHIHMMNLPAIGTINQPWHLAVQSNHDIENFTDELVRTKGDCLVATPMSTPYPENVYPSFNVLPEPGQLYANNQLCGLSLGASAGCIETVPAGECGYIYCNTGAPPCEKIQNPNGGRCTNDVFGTPGEGVCIRGECQSGYSSYYHCGRFGQECNQIPRSRREASFACLGFACGNCAPRHQGYDCRLPGPATPTNNNSLAGCGCENGGSCYDGPGRGLRCYCTPPFYGEKCSISRYTAWPSDDNVTILINPKGEFQGHIWLVDAPQQRECYFSKIDAPLDGFSEDLDGWYLQLPYDSPCADILVTREVKVLVQYHPVIITGLDERVTIIFDNPSIQDYNLTTANLTTHFLLLNVMQEKVTIENINNAFPVSLQLQDDSGAPMTQGNIGDTVILTLTLNSLSDYTSLRLLSVFAGSPGSIIEQIQLVEDGCVARDMYGGVVSQEAVYEGNMIRLHMNLFTMIDSNTVSYTVNVQVCGSFVEDRCDWRALPCYDGTARRRRSVDESGTDGIQTRQLQTNVTIRNQYVHQAADPAATTHPDDDVPIGMTCPECKSDSILLALVVSLGMATFLLLVVSSVLIVKVILHRKGKR